MLVRRKPENALKFLEIPDRDIFTVHSVSMQNALYEEGSLGEHIGVT